MKCISCGKNFDEEKYYRICPKCGTYNNVKKATPDFSQGSRQTGGSCGNGQMGTSGNNASGGQQDPFWQELHGGNRGQEYRQQSDGQQTYGQPNYDQQDIFHRTEQEMYQRRQGEKEKKPNRPLVISLIILVIIGIVLFIISVVLVAGQDVAGSGAHAVLEEEITERPADLGESLLLEEESGMTVTVETVELIAGPEASGDFPEGTKLIGARLHCPGADNMTEYSFDPSPLGMVYVGCDGTYTQALSGDLFMDYPSHQQLVGDRENFDEWNIRYGDPSRGYVYFFIPADANSGTLYVERQDISDGHLTEIYAIDFTLGEVR